MGETISGILNREDTDLDSLTLEWVNAFDSKRDSFYSMPYEAGEWWAESHAFFTQMVYF